MYRTASFLLKSPSFIINTGYIDILTVPIRFHTIEIHKKYAVRFINPGERLL